MNYQSELQFLLLFLKNHKINASFLEEDYEIRTFDFHLRERLSYTQEYSLIENFLQYHMRSNTLYKIMDEFQCIYYILLLPTEERPKHFLIGPYTQTCLNEHILMEYIERYSITPQNFQELNEIFYHIPHLPNDFSLQTLLHTFAEIIWGGQDNFEVCFLDLHLTEIQYHPFLPSNLSEEYAHITGTLIDTYFAKENELIKAVSQGQAAQAEEIFNNITPFLQISEDNTMLRNLQNYALSLNTLFRKSAEANTINSSQITDLVFRFSHKIELCTSPEACYSLLREMIRKYALLIKNHSMNQYSILVQQAIKYITMDLSADLSLHTMAERLNVNASYLSTHFKKVTGTSYTEYVNHKRIEHSLLLLNTTSLQIQTIAQYCGISDLNYFTKLFKKHVHMSPTAYRKKMLEK